MASTSISLRSAVQNTGAGSIGVDSTASISQGSQSVDKNTTTVNYSVTVKYYCPSGWSFGGSTRSQAGYLDVIVGGSVATTLTIPLQNGWTNGTTAKTASGSVTIAHNSDGTKSTSVQLRMRSGTDQNNANPPYTYSAGTSGTSNLTLTTIPRTSVITVPSTVTVGTAFDITINRASSNFTHKVEFIYNNASTVISSNATTSATHTVPTSFASNLANVSSVNATIKVTTLNGSTTIGSTSTTVAVTIPDSWKSDQTLTMAITDTGKAPSGTLLSDSTIGITDAIVVGLSVKAVKITASAQHSATIKSIKVVNGSQSKSLTASGTVSFSNPSSDTFTAELTDSRGYVKTVTKKVSMIQYINPTVDDVTIERTSATASTAVLSAKGKVFNGSVGKIANKGAVTWTSSIKDTSGTFGTTLSGNNWNSNNVNVSGTDPSNSFTFTVTITDSLGGTATRTVSLGVATPDFFIGKGKFIGSWGMLPRRSLTDANLPHPSDISGQRRTITPYFVSNQTTSNKPAGDGYLLNFTWDNNEVYDSQLYLKNGGMTGKNPHMQIRGNNNGTWDTKWQTVLDTANFINYVYPVGSIYMSVNSTSPATLFGGTWEQLKDTFLLAAGTSYTAGTTGGEATHTLSQEEMPSHYHDMGGAASAFIAWRGTSGNSSLGSGNNVASLAMENNWAYKYGTARTGGGKAHNNMPPYLAVYVWKRTA